MELNKIENNYISLSLKFTNLSVWLPSIKKPFSDKTKPKPILKNISGIFKSGELNALIGPSGSGKTTLLNFLASRNNTSNLDKNYNLSLNDSKLSSTYDIKNIIGYVTQEDILDPTMTPRQLFAYYYKLRKNKNINSKIETLAKTLNIENVLDTIIGGATVKGLSGGEKKRVSVGLELISNPKILFLDEPTTGLDSENSLELIKIIKKLTDKNIIVVCTIHQPSKEIIEIFDKIYILADGINIYYDNYFRIENYMKALDFEIKEDTNYIEYFMQKLDKDDIRIEMISKEIDINEEKVNKLYFERILKFSNYYINNRDEKYIQDLNKPGDNNINEILNVTKNMNQLRNGFIQFGIIFQKLFKKYILNIKIIPLRILQLAIYLILLYALYNNLGDYNKNTIIAIQNRIGYTFMYTVLTFFIGLSFTSQFVLAESNYFKKETESRLYTKSNYYMVLQVIPIIFMLIYIFIFFIVTYFIIDLYEGNNNENIFYYYIISYITNFCAMAYGYFISIIANKAEDIGALNPIIALPLIMTCGFFANIKTIGKYMFAISYLSPPRFMFQAFSLQLFEERKGVEKCFVTMNDKVVEINYNSNIECNPFTRLDFYENELWLNLLILIVIGIVIRIISFAIFVKKFKEHVDVSKEIPDEVIEENKKIYN